MSLKSVYAVLALALIASGAFLVSVGYGFVPLGVNYVVYVTVKDQRTLAPLEGVSVRITCTTGYSFTLTTNSQGQASSDLGIQQSSYVASKAGYVTQSGGILFSEPSGSTFVSYGSIFLQKIGDPIYSSSVVTVAVVGQGTTNPVAGVHEYAVGDDILVSASASSGWSYYGTYRNGVLHSQANPAEVLDLQAVENVTVYFVQSGGDSPPDVIDPEPQDLSTPTTKVKYWLREYGSVVGFSMMGAGCVVGLAGRKNPAKQTY